MNDPIRCLSVRQPWAWAIVVGAKNVENRTWTTEYRGRIVIQASSSKSVVNSIARDANTSLPSFAFSYSALVGVVDLVDITPLSEALESNPWAWGPYCWHVANPRQFRKPIPAKGKLNLYSLSPGLAEKARDAIGTAQIVQPDDIAKTWIAAMTNLDTEQTRNQALIDAYLELEDSGSALRLAEHAVSKWGRAEDFLDRAAARNSAGDLLGAIKDANSAIDMDRKNAAGYAVRSNVYLALSDFDRRKAAELDPKYAADLEDLENADNNPE